jgi:hypothetical protein
VDYALRRCCFLTLSFHPNSLKSIMKFQSDWCTQSEAINEFFINQIGADTNFKALKSESPVGVHLVAYDFSI